MSSFFVVNPPSIDFGCVEVGMTSSPVVATVTNVGSATSGPLSVTVSGDGISATGCEGMAVEPKGACTISVTAKRQTDLSPISGTIEVGDNPGNTKRISVSAICAGTPRQFMLTPSPLDLDSVPMGNSVSGTLVLTSLSTRVMTNIAIAVSGDGFSLSPTGTCTDTLAPNQFCKIEVTFKAGPTPGPAKGTVIVSLGGVTKTVALVATVVSTEPPFSMTPTSASFVAELGTPRAPSTFHVTGDLGSTPLTVSITGVNKDDFSFTTDCDQPHAPGVATSCQVTVAYSPKVIPATNSTATLTVAQPGATGASAIATLTGTVETCGSGWGIFASNTDFGNVVVGRSSTALTFTIVNGTGGDYANVEITASPSPFAIATNNCAGKALPSRSTCTFTAQFTPAAGDEGVMQGQFKAILGTGACSLSLLSVTGTAVPPAKLAVEPGSVEFGMRPLLQESPPQTLTVSNTGGAPTGALKVDKAGAEFTINDDTCTGKTLTTTGTTMICTITVTYTPPALAAEATGSITVRDTSGVAAEPVILPLHGQGTLPPTLVLSPSSVCPQSEADDPLCIPSASTHRFSNMPVGQNTPEMTFVLSNTTDPVNLPDSGELSVALEGDATTDFAVTSSTCRAPLVSTAGMPPTCSVTLTFKPSAAGLRKAVLKVTTSRGGSAQATLEGKGLT